MLSFYSGYEIISAWNIRNPSAEWRRPERKGPQLPGAPGHTRHPGTRRRAGRLPRCAEVSAEVRRWRQHTGLVGEYTSTPGG